MTHVRFVGIWTGRLILVMSGMALVTAAPIPDATATPSLSQAAAPVGEVGLGSVMLPRQVLADGQPLEAGTYQLRLTSEPAQPETPGQLAALNRWVEFLQDDEVKGREVVSIVPPGEIAEVASSGSPGPGVALVQMLKDADYVRIWINRDGTHYLLHLPPR